MSNVDDDSKKSNTENGSEKASNSQKEKTRKMISQVEDLPSLPAVIQRINHIINKPGSDADDVGNVLETEPSLTAKILKMINSAYFGLQRRITSVSEAVVYLGFETIRNLALNASVMRISSSSDKLGRFEEYDFNWTDFWKKSVATGLATETVARELRVPGYEAAMPAGTLHMLGILVLRSKLPIKFERILEHSTNNNDYFESERQIIGTTSLEIGYWISKDWSMPEETIIGLSNWLEPLNAPGDSQLIPLLVHTGERLARARNVGWNPVEDVGLSKAILSELSITPGKFEDILSQYRRDLKDAQLFLEICEEIN